VQFTSRHEGICYEFEICGTLNALVTLPAVPRDGRKPSLNCYKVMTVHLIQLIERYTGNFQDCVCYKLANIAPKFIYLNYN